jgi:hypothetical protein
MRKFIIASSQLFSAFVTEDGIRNIFIAAIGTGFGLSLLFHRIAAAGAKLGTWRKIFAAGGALIEHKLLMAALGAEFSVNWD